MNDIVQSSDKFDFSMYADDTCLSICTNIELYDEILLTEIEKVNEWFSCNELLLNIDKTDYLMFGPRYNKNYVKGEHDMTELHSAVPAYLTDDVSDDCNKTELNTRGEFILKELHSITPQYLIQEHFETSDGTITIENNTVKYLGLHIDNVLNFNKHISITCCKIIRLVNSFWKCPIQDIKIKKQIYHALVESHLNYGILVYASNFSKHVASNDVKSGIPNNLTQLVVTQNKILRAIFRIPKYDRINNVYNDSSSLYKELGVLKLEDLYRYNLGLLTHNSIYSDIYPTRIKELFTLRTEIIDRNTRTNEMDLYYPTPKTMNTERKPSIAGSKLWNSLPEQLKSIKSLRKFKAELKKYLTRNY